jgi:Bacterial protein of unknown function (DUF885)
MLVKEKIVPAFGRYRDFLANEYLPAARDGVGLSAIPNGSACYEALLRFHSSLPISAKQVHIALAQVKVVSDPDRGMDITYILESVLKFWIDGREIVVNAGEVLIIPPLMPHKAEALVETIDLDVFTPPRADWLNRKNKYLRGD